MVTFTVVAHCTVVVIFISQIDNKYVRQTWPFSVTWRHRTRDIRFAIGHFLLVILWNRASIYIGFGDIGPLAYCNVLVRPSVRPVQDQINH